MEKALIQNFKEKFHDELFGYVLPFWLEHGKDPAHGGVFTCLDRAGRIYSTDKSVWMQGRCAWTFSRLCNQYGGKEEWLSLAKSCIDFLEENCIDPADGRMYFTVTGDGKPLRKRRYFFSETFYILANAEYSLAAGDEKALENARRYYDFVIEIYGDPASDPYKITPKTNPETRCMRTMANSMILLDVTSQMRRSDPKNRQKYDEISRMLTDDILRYHVKDSIGAVLENVGPAGEFYEDISAGRVMNPGHDLEASWFLMEEAQLRGDRALKQKALDIYDWALERGWDKQYGGILYFTDVKGFPPEAYEHDMKLWWPHNEAINAALKFYSVTGEQRYWDDFVRVAEYAFAAFSDHEYGEWFGYLRRDGSPTEPPCKGSTYKGPFHLPRMLLYCDGIFDKLIAERIEHTD